MASASDKAKGDTLRGVGTMRGLGAAKPPESETAPEPAALEGEPTAVDGTETESEQKKSQRLIAQNRTVPPQWINPSAEDRRKYGIPDPASREAREEPVDEDASERPSDATRTPAPAPAADRNRTLWIAGIALGALVLFFLFRLFSNAPGPSSPAPTATPSPAPTLAPAPQTTAQPAATAPAAAPPATSPETPATTAAPAPTPPKTTARASSAPAPKPAAPKPSAENPGVPDKPPF